MSEANEPSGSEQRSAAENGELTERLSISEEMFRSMIESVKDYAIFMLDPDGRVVVWNPGAQRIEGYEAEEIIGQHFSRLFTPEDVAAGKPQQELDDTVRNGHHEEQGWRVRKDGSRFWAHVTVTPLRDPSGQLRGFIKVTHDMSERQAVERAGQDIAAQLQGVIRTAVDGILAIDEWGVIEWLNPAAQAIFGYTAEEVIGRNIKMLMPEPYHSQHDGYLQNYLRTGQRKIIGIGREVLGRRKDGSTFPLDLAVSEVKLGNRRMFTGIVRDITLRKEQERALMAAKEAAEAASRAKDHFLAIVSHELRTPLTPILAATDILKSRDDLTADVKDDLATIRRNAEREARLVDDLLNLTRLNRGKIELHQEVVDAHALLRAVLNQLQSEIDAKGLELTLSLRAREPHIWADPGRIEQVFSNVLGNAIKFTPEDEGITIRTSNVPGGKLRIEIIDTGIGIERDVLERLFTPFEQGERTVTRRYGGLGLGLTISKGIMDLHHGTLSAQSEGRGKGSTFVIELETAAPLSTPVRTRPVAGRHAPGAGRKILLVEDHPDTSTVLSKLLERFGYEVTTASSVKEALAISTSQKFDLLISDIGLPDGSGLDVMRTLKTLGIKGVAISGFGQAEDLLRSREAGFVEHLVKPVNFQMLESVVSRLAS